MSVAETIQSMFTNTINAYSKLEEKGATMPEKKNLENLASTIDTVTGGGGGEDLYSQYISGETDKLVVNTNKFREGAFSGLKVKELELLQPHTAGSSGTIFYGCTYLQKMNYIRYGSYGQNMFNNCGGGVEYATSEVVAIFHMSDYATGDNNTFLNARMKEITFNGLVTIGKSSSDTTSTMFSGARIQKVSFPDLTTWYAPSYKYSNFSSTYINRLYLEKLTTIQSNHFYGATSIGKTFLGTNCSLSNSSTSTIPNGMARFYIPVDSLTYYVFGTNWTTLFNNTPDTTDTRMFVYKDCVVGDELVTQVDCYGTDVMRQYSIEWYEEDTFTTLAQTTAQENKRYYGKLTLVYEDVTIA